MRKFFRAIDSDSHSLAALVKSIDVPEDQAASIRARQLETAGLAITCHKATWPVGGPAFRRLGHPADCKYACPSEGQTSKEEWNSRFDR